MRDGGLQVIGARYTVKGATILNGIDLYVAPGEVVGLVGPNGSGKSSLLKTIVGAVPAADVRLVVGRQDMTKSRTLRARHIALVEQQAVETSLTVRDVVSLGRTPYQRVFAPSDSTDQVHVTDAMRRTGTIRFGRRAFNTLSGGERQRVQIARALAQTTPFLLLDEPTNHLDLAAQVTILELIDAIASSGVGVLLAIHDLTHAAGLCDRIVLLDHGHVVDVGPPHDVLTERAIATVFGVTAHWLIGSEGRALITDARQRRPPRHRSPASRDPLAAGGGRSCGGANLNGR